MRKELERIIEFFKNETNLILIPTILLVILLIISLFIKDFNLLKFFVFFNLLVAFSIFGLVFYLARKPIKEGERTSPFFLIQNLLDFLNEGVAIYDNDFKIVFVNKAFAQIVGLEREDILNLIIDQGMIKNEKYEMLANIFFPFLKGEDLKIISQNPEILEVKFSSPQEKYFYLSYLDIVLANKKYKLRIVLDKTQDVIESQRRLEFIQLVSHNLLTPLSEIRWTLEAMETKNFSEENKELWQRALNIIKSTLGLTEMILTMIRAEGSRLELVIQNVDFKQVIENILEIFEDKIEEKKLKINLQLSDEINTIPGDSNLVSMLFYSLIENAVLYNKMNGGVFISIQKFPHRPYAQIIIEDTGIGMSKEDLENLFKKYYRGKKTKNVNVQGLGIGLYTAKNILDLHGAEIKVESEENKGTKISILWPLDVGLLPH